MASQGSLLVYTFLANEAVPVPDAVVTVTKREGEENVVLALRRTDRSGKTTPITIETPDIRYSLTPQSETVPFTSVDVRVEHPSTYTAISENVQIFPGQVSLENVMLLPLEDNETDKNKKEITIVTPQDL